MLAALTLLATASLTAAWNTTAGCNSAGFDLDSSGKINRTLPSGRQYLLHVPSDYDASTGHPAVLSFHGGELCEDGTT
jgi:poly(3-hydroxybutyrate) depolymerase